MVKLFRLCVLVLVAGIAVPRIAAAELTNHELRQTVRAAEYWLNVEFPLSAAIECDQRRGASGTWDVDSRCNVEIERIAALISLITGGAFLPADAVTAWCSAAEIVNIAKEAVQTIRKGLTCRRSADQRAGRHAAVSANAFNALNTTLGFISQLFQEL